MDGSAGHAASAEELFARYVTTGAQDALADVVLLCTPELLVRARALTRDPDTAADLVQATFLAAIEARARFDAEKRLVPWLIGILGNLHLYWRRQRARAPDADRLAPPPDFDPPALVDRKLVRETVAAAVAALPDNYRQVVALHLHDELAPEEIAARLGRPSNTVRTQLWRGLRLLRGLLPPNLALGAWLWISVRSASAQGGAIGAPGHDGDGETVDAARAPSATTRRRSRMFTAVVLVLFTIGGAAALAWWPDRRVPPADLGSGVARDPTAESPSAPAGSGTRSGETAQRQPVTPGEAAARLEVRLLWAEGNRPAAGQTLRVAAGTLPGTSLLQTWFRHVRHGVADAEGRVVFDSLPAGPARLLLDDSLVVVAVDLVAGQSLERTVVLEPKCRLDGEVVDAEGRPVAGADVWISSTGGQSAPGYVAGHSDATGRFTVHALWSHWSLWATAAGHGCSLEFGESQPAHVSRPRLVLTPLARLAGRIVDEAGSPAPGAMVAVFPRDRTRAPTGDGFVPPQYVVADQGGRYEFAHLTRGTFQLLARDARHRVHLETVDCEAAVQEHDVRLGRTGATVRGHVHLPPDRLATVFVYARPALPSASPRSHGFTCATTGIGADGSYELRHVHPGAVTVRVMSRRPGVQTGIADRQLQLADGSVVTCDFGEPPAQRLAGRVVDELGRGLANVTVFTLPAHCDWTDLGTATVQTVSGAGGEFVLGLQNQLPHVCFAVDADSPGAISFPCARSAAARPGAVAVTLTLPSAHRSRASVRGMLPALWSGRPELQLMQLPLRQRLAVAVGERGGFAVERLPPGDYALLAAMKGEAVATLAARFTLAPEQALDLGQLHASELGTLRLAVSHRDGRPARLARPIWVDTRHDRLPITVVRALDAQGRAEVTLGAGEYELSLACHGARAVTRTCRVVAGSNVDVVVTLDDAVPCHLTLPVPAGRFGKRIVLEVVDAQGGALVREVQAEEDLRFTFDLGLPPGELRVRGVTSGGQTVDAPIRVGQQPLSLELTLR